MKDPQLYYFQHSTEVARPRELIQIGKSQNQISVVERTMLQHALYFHDVDTRSSFPLTIVSLQLAYKAVNMISHEDANVPIFNVNKVQAAYILVLLDNRTLSRIKATLLETPCCQPGISPDNARDLLRRCPFFLNAFRLRIWRSSSIIDEKLFDFNGC